MPQTATVSDLTTGRAPFVEEARERGELYITQAYELYSQENHESWRGLYARIRPRWERYANDHFLRGVEALQLPADRIPRLADINQRLQAADRVSGAAGERVCARVSCSSIACAGANFPPPSPSAPPPHGLPARAGYLPRCGRPHPDAHRQGVRGRAGALRRLRAHGGGDDGGPDGPRRAGAAADEHHPRVVALFLVHGGIRADARAETGRSRTAAGC